ncbi:hypothetical protein [Tabrizicola sp.]|uniref:hypothetical protein n=1 Tax=Tabrizicola sp. TaxID=2005166 RepID=UPI003F343247
MLRFLAVIVAIGLAQLTPVSAFAQGLNIVVMGEDADEDSVPRGNRIFNRVIAAMTEEMNVQGYNIFDETAIAMDINPANRVRRQDSELISVARAVQAPPLDVVVVFTIYASVSESAYADIVRPEVRIPGRILNVRTGQQIASFEVSGLELPPLPVVCERECLLESVGDSAAILGAELASALTAKLEGFVAAPAAEGVIDSTAVIVTDPTVTVVTPADTCESLPTAYVIRFVGFETEEITALEEYMNSYACVESARPVRASGSLAEYWYETRSDTARLTRNLRLTLEHMGVEGQVQFSGGTFVLKRIPTR